MDAPHGGPGGGTITLPPPSRHAKSPLELDLLNAAAAGNVKRCEELLDDGSAPADLLEVCTPERQTALILAAAAGHVEATGFLLLRRADVEATDVHMRTPLSYAAARQNTEVVKVLLDHGADVEATDCIVREMGCVLL
eukprot:TRINITY_DN123923_c0_g1_i1.p2 TRINITY_DN123923_c0_g1~~TRINITY_DN123923_c0_g1_i1.p2  ORF type:complete len:138 (-),score=42.04 TRINITY_DN123923_c0_g1_i1:61-474(-)